MSDTRSAFRAAYRPDSRHRTNDVKKRAGLFRTVSRTLRVSEDISCLYHTCNRCAPWDLDESGLIDYWLGPGALLIGHNRPAAVAALRTLLARGILCAFPEPDDCLEAIGSELDPIGGEGPLSLL